MSVSYKDLIDAAEDIKEASVPEYVTADKLGKHLINQANFSEERFHDVQALKEKIKEQIYECEEQAERAKEAADEVEKDKREVSEIIDQSIYDYPSVTDTDIDNLFPELL